LITLFTTIESRRYTISSIGNVLPARRINARAAPLRGLATFLDELLDLEAVMRFVICVSVLLFLGCGEEAKKEATKVGGQTKDMAKEMGERAKMMGAKAKEHAKELGGKAEEVAKEVGEKAKEIGVKVEEKAKDVGEAVKEKAKEAGDKIKGKDPSKSQ
jgi:hypothetical protein